MDLGDRLLERTSDLEAHGFRAVLPKPYTIEELAAALAGVLGRS